MAKNKDNLLKLLEFLDKSILNEPENVWFVEELRKRVCKNAPMADQKDLRRIEQYLGLDYIIDTIPTQIDYTFINDEFLRICLESDYREMLRYRLGTRGHIQDFAEVCRYALLQIERLLNIYYTSKGATIEERNTYIQNYNSKYKADSYKGIQSVEAIQFSIKVWAFFNEFKLDSKVKQTILNIAKVRNIKSHGSSQPQADEIFFQEHYALLLRSGYPLLPNGLVDWTKLDYLESSKRNLYNNLIKNSPEHQRYIDLEWQRRESFDEVAISLNYFVAHISQQIIFVNKQ